jgi:hypothetical protein
MGQTQPREFTPLILSLLELRLDSFELKLE